MALDTDNVTRRMMGVQMIDINVDKGQNKTHFRVHKAILCAKVPYFDRMLNSKFREEEENRIDIPEDDAEVFDLLMLWVYTGKLPALIPVPDQTYTCTLNFDALAFYALADKMCLDNLMDEVASAYIERNRAARSLPAVDYLDYIYEILLEHTALRKYAAHCLHYILHGIPKTLKYL